MCQSLTRQLSTGATATAQNMENVDPRADDILKYWCDRKPLSCLYQQKIDDINVFTLEGVHCQVSAFFCVGEMRYQPMEVTGCFCNTGWE